MVSISDMLICGFLTELICGSAFGWSMQNGTYVDLRGSKGKDGKSFLFGF